MAEFVDVMKTAMRMCARIRKCIKLPIPADIAQKLGIQPIAKENSG